MLDVVGSIIKISDILSHLQYQNIDKNRFGGHSVGERVQAYEN